MKKTLTINLGGLVFHIDEDAFKRLKKYLDDIRFSFEYENEANEVLQDIESRIAEHFGKILNDKNQVVTIPDVEKIISILGQPEEFSDNNQSNYEYKYKHQKRMFRDSQNSVLGGVCSGMGAYFDIDPIIFRVLFIILFFGAGTGMLLYIILWIVIPEAKTRAQRLQMRGEPVNLSNLGKSVKDEFENVRRKYNF